MINAGMKFEGLARQKYRSNVGFEDCNMYSMIREDFYNRTDDKEIK
jgi:ribosomal-protein-alanine N-acetyltransferase